jgi:hypothetical protein
MSPEIDLGGKSRNDRTVVAVPCSAIDDRASLRFGTDQLSSQVVNGVFTHFRTARHDAEVSDENPQDRKTADPAPFAPPQVETRKEKRRPTGRLYYQ